MSQIASNGVRREFFSSHIHIPLIFSNMPRRNLIKPLLEWLKQSLKSKELSYRKFYKSGDFYSIYKSSAIGHECMMSQSVFVREMNNIVEKKQFEKLKSSFKKYEGFKYVIVYDCEKKYSLNELRYSTRTSSTPAQPSQLSSRLPSQTAPSSRPTQLPSQLPAQLPWQPAPSSSLAQLPLQLSSAQLPAPSQLPAQLPLQPAQLPIQLPLQLPAQLPAPLQLPAQLAPSTPAQLPIQLPLQLSSRLPLQPAPSSTNTQPSLPSMSIPTFSPSIQPLVVQPMCLMPQLDPTAQSLVVVGSKFNSSIALSFFLGKERARTIISDPTIDNYEVVVKAHISDQIELLQNANLYADGWQRIVNDNDELGVCNPTHISTIKNKAVYIAVSVFMPETV